MPDDQTKPDKTESEPEPEAERDDKGKFKKKEPETPEEPEKKEEPEAPKEPDTSDEDLKKQIETLNKELLELRNFKANRMKEIDDHEARLKAQRTKEDQKLKGFKEEKKSEGDKTTIPPLYKKMSFGNLTETSKKMRKK